MWMCFENKIQYSTIQYRAGDVCFELNQPVMRCRWQYRFTEFLVLMLQSALSVIKLKNVFASVWLDQICTFLCSSVCPSVWDGHALWSYGASSADFSLWLDSPMFWAPWHQSMCTHSQPSFTSSTWKRGGVWSTDKLTWYLKNGWI